MKCAHGIQCFQELGKMYRFYLSFENSICKDYMTEKVKNPLTNFMVPIVLGGANYEVLLPKHSFINVRFYTPQTLAKYLIEVGSNYTIYNSFFEWRKDYVVYNRSTTFCNICEALNINKRPKTYKDVEAWWNKKTDCLTAEQYFKNIL